LNEPSVYVNKGYFIADWCPGVRSYTLGVKAFFNQISAHKQAYISMKKANPRVKVGIAMNMTAFVPVSQKFFDRKLTKFLKWIFNEYFINRIRGSLDFLGINSYTSYKIQLKNPIMSGGVADSLYQLVAEAKHWNLPIYITENGTPASDNERQEFIFDSLSQLSKAIENGADLRGYFYWSLIDNFEWSSGYSMKFGLHTIDRKPKKSAEFYKKIIEESTK
jgi:beta-glucosidase